MFSDSLVSQLSGAVLDIGMDHYGHIMACRGLQVMVGMESLNGNWSVWAVPAGVGQFAPARDWQGATEWHTSVWFQEI